MDKYVVSPLLKTLVTITIILTYYVQCTPTPALMGGHLVNSNHTTRTADDNSYDMYSEYDDSREVDSDIKDKPKAKESDSEEIPDPSPLVVPGYNLPENIFNSGKPFYVEKDPLTGTIDFAHKSPEVRSDDQLYDYVDEQPSDNIDDKANINRKDGSVSSHKQSDINQLTPNFHDFLNLPVKYNPEKYVYPLISSSYASTKIQGSVNKFHNHKDYNSYKTTTKKPTVSPTYYTTHSSYFNPRTTQRTFSTTTVTTTTSTKSPITKRYPEVYLTTPLTNVLNTGMSHPSFGEEYDYYDTQTEVPTTASTTTTKKPVVHVYSTTKKANIGDIYLTTDSTTAKPQSTSTGASTTTKRTLSLFEQLFGDYDETITTTERTRPTLFANLPNKKVDNFETTSTTTTTQESFVTNKTNIDKNVLSGSDVGLDTNYEYNDDYNERVDDNLAVENKVTVHSEDSLSVEPLKPEINTVVSIKAQDGPVKEVIKPQKSAVSLVTTENSYLVQKTTTEEARTKEITSTSTTTSTTTRKPTITPNNPVPVSTPKVTSLPLGENHINTPSINRDPIIVATQNLREKLNSEKVQLNDYEGLPDLINTHELQNSQAQEPMQRPDQSAPMQGNFQINNQHAPSSSNIHIPPGQDTVSFVMGHHQSVEGETGVGGQYVGTSLNESPYDSNPFRPVNGQQATVQESDTYPQSRPAPQPVNYPQNRPVLNNYPQNRPAAMPSNRPMNVPQNRPNYASPNRPAPPPQFVSPSRPVAPPQYIDSSGSAATIQPLKQSEASLAIGVPVTGNKPIPGKVVDDIPTRNEGNKFDFSKEGGSKVVFPQEKIGLLPHKNYPPQLPNQQSFNSQNNREVLKLNSKPMYHQLPSDLTPPKENEIVAQPQKYDRPARPPWDPRPGHFYAGKPEYARPPRPRPDVAYKRIDNLPNILPQFRPNVKQQYPPYHFERVNRPQPLFERPSNRPIGFFEKMLPPPPPQPFRGHTNPGMRNIPQIDERSPLKTNLQSLDENESPMAEDRIMNIEPENEASQPQEESKIQDLSLYQTPPNIKIHNRRIGEDVSEIETLQMIQAKNEKENEIKPQDQDESDINKPIQISAENSLKDVNEKTIYKVYPVNTPPLKLDAIDSEKKEGVVVGTRAEMPLPPSKIDSSFPYGLNDRNDAPILKPHPKLQNPSKSEFPYPLERPAQPNTLDDSQQNGGYLLSNLWDEETIEPKIVNGNKANYNQISATLKTYTEKPIAVAYTPTESHYDTYSIPGFGRPGVVESEIYRDRYLPNYDKISHRIDTEIAVPAPEREGFQTPFQPSLQLDSANQGWTAVREKNKTNPVIEKETTTMPLATTGEFDIENFKPQLEGGFKPMYTIPEERLSEPVTEILEPRSERK